MKIFINFVKIVEQINKNVVFPKSVSPSISYIFLSTHLYTYFSIVISNNWFSTLDLISYFSPLNDQSITTIYWQLNDDTLLIINENIVWSLVCSVNIKWYDIIDKAVSLPEHYLWVEKINYLSLSFLKLHWV